MIEELKSLLKLNDDVSKNLKIIGLKFIHSICKDDFHLNEFLNVGGMQLIQEMLKYELKNSGNSEESNKNIKNQYMTNEPYLLRKKEITENENDRKIVDECFKIINKVIKNKDDAAIDPCLLSDMICIIE